MSSSWDVIWIGCATQDVVEGSGAALGGSVYYGASALMGVEDAPSQRVWCGGGVEVGAQGWRSGLMACAGPRFENVYGEDGCRAQRVLRAAPLLEVGVPDDSAQALCFFAPVLGELGDAARLARWVCEARGAGVGFVVLFAQGMLREVAPARGEVVPRPFEVLEGGLGGVDVVLFSEEDVEGRFDEALRWFGARVPIAVCTRGASGAVLCQGGSRVEVGVYAQAKVVELTGAGDVFGAVLGWALFGGAQAEDALRLAAGAASMVIEGVGCEALGGEAQWRERAQAVALLGDWCYTNDND